MALVWRARGTAIIKLPEAVYQASSMLKRPPIVAVIALGLVVVYARRDHRHLKATWRLPAEGTK